MDPPLPEKVAAATVAIEEEVREVDAAEEVYDSTASTDALPAVATAPTAAAAAAEAPTATANDDKASLRSSYSSRQTVEDLESLTVYGNNSSKLTGKEHAASAAGRPTTTTAATRPGAVAVLGHRERATGADDPQQHDYHAQVSALTRSDSEGSSNCSPTCTESTTRRDASTDCLPQQQSTTEDDEIPMIHAELAVDEVPIMIRAELVPAPTQAYPIEEGHHLYVVESVHFDEEAPPHVDGASTTTPQYVPPGTAPFPNDNNDDDDDDDASFTKMKRFYTRNSSRIWQFHVLLLIIGLVLAIAVPKVMEHSQRQVTTIATDATAEITVDAVTDSLWNDDDDDDDFPMPSPEEQEEIKDIVEGFLEDLVEGISPPTPSPTKAPTPAPSAETVHPFRCAKRTLDIALDQIELAKLSNTTQEERTFRLCPYTKYTLGTLADPQGNDHTIVGGDYPLTALMDSVEIRCGKYGRREDHCVIDGGFIQVLLNPSLPGELANAMVNRTDDVVFRGITFTGSLQEEGTNSSSSNNNNNNMGGVSVFANNPGTNVTFIDCDWVNMTAPQGLVHIGGASSSPWSFGPSTEVTFENCSFSNITYDNGPLMGSFGQGLTVRGSSFSNISLPVNIHPCSVGDGNLEWCHGLMYCFDGSSCELEDICVQNLDYAGPAAIAATSFNTNLTLSGMKHAAGLELHPSLLTPSVDECASGLVQFEDASYHNPLCLDDANNWTSWNNTSCFS